MPTVSLVNGHAFAAGFMLGMHHDYRIQNPSRGFLCVNELDFGAPLQAPMVSVFREKLPAVTFRNAILEARRFGGREALDAGIVDALGGLDDALAFVRSRGLHRKAESGIYGTLREEMYRGLLEVVSDHGGNQRWREKLEEEKGRAAEEARKRVEGLEGGKKGAKL